MRSVTALEVRRKFGEIVDAAAAGERIVIERAGHPIAAIVPLADLARVDPDRRKADALAAIAELRRINRGVKLPPDYNPATAIREMRDARTEQIAKAIESAKPR